MIRNKILASPSSIGKINNKPYKILESADYEIVKNPYGRKLTIDETISLGKDCIGIVAGVETLDKYVIDSIPNLKCISRVGVGMDSVDIEYAKSKGIKVLNTPDGPTRAVAELTIGLVFSILRKIPNAHLDMKNGKWKKQTGNLLFDKKIGIVGLGRIGKMTAKLFQSLGNEVFAYDLNPDINWSKENKIKICDMMDILKNSDIITFHVPGNTDGTPIVGLNEFSIMKDTVSIVNVARGGIIDENDLYNFLKNKEFASAAIDVFEEEPYNGKLSELNNVVLTPHIGSYAKEGKLKMEVDAVKNLINALK